MYCLSRLALWLTKRESALKCDLRDDASTRERLARYGMQAVQYEDGLSTARRIRASRYLGMQSLPPPPISFIPSLIPTSLFRVQLKTQSRRQGSILRGCARISHHARKGPKWWGRAKEMRCDVMLTAYLLPFFDTRPYLFFPVE